jgi:hypothetical protein
MMLKSENPTSTSDLSLGAGILNAWRHPYALKKKCSMGKNPRPFTSLMLLL